MKKIKNANILLACPEGYQIEKQDIFVESSRVKSVGMEQPCDEEEDWDGWTLIPSFFNIHCHLGESVFRTVIGDTWNRNRYAEYMENYISHLSEEEKIEFWQQGAADAFSELEKNGITGFCAERVNELGNCRGMNAMCAYPVKGSVRRLKYKKKRIEQV